MTDIMKHKTRIEVVNIHTADPQANVSVFLVFPTAHFLNTNKLSDARVSVKDKLNKRVILASRTNGGPTRNQKNYFSPTHQFNIHN